MMKEVIKMVRNIKNFIAQFHDKTFATLWLESLLFSVLFGIGFHSWLVSVLMFLGLSWLMNKWKGTLYTIFTLSFLWGFMIFCIVYSVGGWVWGLALGSLVFYKGVRIHLRELKESLNFNFFGSNNVREWRQDNYWGRQNLN